MAAGYKINSSPFATFLITENGSVTSQQMRVSSETLLQDYASSETPCWSTGAKSPGSYLQELRVALVPI